jgi:hypothetical protein
MEYQSKHSTAERDFRKAILSGVEPSIVARATLEARGINTDELEARLRQSVEYKH